jgi:hypothetical protein
MSTLQPTLTWQLANSLAVRYADIGSPGKVQNLREVPEKPAMPLVMLHLGSWNAMN